MNILYVSTNSNTFNGASKCYIDVIGRLSKNNKVIALFCHEGPLQQIVSDMGIETFQIKEYGRPWIKSKKTKSNFIFNLKCAVRKVQNRIFLLKLEKFILKNPIDIIYINSLTEYSVALLARKMRIPLVWHIREFLDEDLQMEFVNEKYARKLIEYSTFEICISDAVNHKFKDRYGLTKTRRIYDGVNIGKFYCERNLFASSKIKIFIFGRLVETKGQLIFLEAINKLSLLHKNIECRIIGSDLNDDFSSKLKDFILKNQLDEIVKIDGFIQDPERLMRKADIVCVCSDNEAFGLVTVESMLSGALVIGSDSGANQELIGNNEFGLLYEYRNAQDLYGKLNYAINNRATVQKIAKNGQKNAKKFSIENNARQIENVLSEAVRLNKKNI